MVRRCFMRWSLATSFAVVLLIGANALAADAPKDEKGPQGTWSLNAWEADGKALTEQHLKNGQLEINGNEYIVTLADKKAVKGTQILDPTKEPKTIDITGGSGPNKGKTFLGIYELTGDEFRVVFAAAGKPRPTTFATAAGSGQWMHVWKRVK
jgi:uncharacterized protein (TIGR03067 family)